jgi:micrococcal nuclease
MKAAVLTALAFLTAVPAYAAPRFPMPTAPFSAIVISAHDGDTLTVQTSDRHWYKVRLESCDSPELQVSGKWPDQPGGWQAHTALDHLILGKTVTVDPVGESYHRLVADIHVRNIDVCEEMAREGEAWVDPRYTHDARLFMAQDYAAKHHLGIWGSSDPIPPWIWRHEAH